jgi:hypothetical protein
LRYEVEAKECLDSGRIELLGRLVARKHLTLVLGRVFLPEVCSLAVEGAGAVQISAMASSLQLAIYVLVRLA